MGRGYLVQSTPGSIGSFRFKFIKETGASLLSKCDDRNKPLPVYHGEICYSVADGDAPPLSKKRAFFFLFCFYTFITCWMVLNRKEFSVDEGERENPGDPTARSLAVLSGPGSTGDNSLHHKVTHIFLGMGQVAI